MAKAGSGIIFKQAPGSWDLDIWGDAHGSELQGGSESKDQGRGKCFHKILKV